jgi:hypothetical protein
MKINLILNYCVHGSTLCEELCQGNWKTMQGSSACFAVMGTEDGHYGQRLTLPDLAPSTNASSSDVRVGCVADAMAQDPITENAVRLARSLSYLTWHQWMAQTPRRITLHNWLLLQPPRLRQPRLRGWPRPCYSCRCLSSTQIGLDHPCRPSLTSLTTSSIRSFISCVRQLVK